MGHTWVTLRACVFPAVQCYIYKFNSNVSHTMNCLKRVRCNTDDCHPLLHQSKWLPYTNFNIIEATISCLTVI